jgi:hypothetical protein
MPKTRKEIDKLKAAWLRDPVWNIENSDGFEEHAEELLEFRHRSEERQRVAREAAIDAEADRLGARGLYRMVLALTERVEKLEDAREEAEMSLRRVSADTRTILHRVSCEP